MRELLKIRGAIAALAIVGVVVLAGLPEALTGPGVEAQNTQTLLTNATGTTPLGNPVAAVIGVGSPMGDDSTYKKSIPFRTGANASGYTIELVTFQITVADDSSAISPGLAIHGDSSGDPGSVVHTFTQTQAVPGQGESGILSFNAPENATLAASTTYHAVISDSTSGVYFAIRQKSLSGVDTNATTGWSFPTNAMNQTDSEAWAFIPRTGRSLQTTFTGKINAAKGVTLDTDPDTTGAQTTTIALDEVDDTDTSDITENEATYTVVLDAAPSANVTITPTSDDTGAVTVSPSTLTFTSSNWATAQMVTVTAVVDDDHGNESVDITHTAESTDSGYSGISIGDVTVTVDDDDTPGVDISTTSFTIAEGNTTGATYTIKLDTSPGEDESVTVTPSAAGTDLRFNPGSLTFGSSDWNTAKQVRVTAVSDADLENDSPTITHSVMGYTGYTATPGSITVTVTDDDSASVMVSTSSLTINEGATGTYTIVLDDQPNGNVTVTITDPTDNTEVTTSPETMTFTTANWNTAQTVTVTAAQDDDMTDDSATITHSVTGANFGSASITNSSVSVTVEDDDNHGVSINPTSFTITESTSAMPATHSKTYTVVLNTDPGATVTVTPSQVTGLTISPTSLMFTAGDEGNWDETQTVTVTSEQDDDLVDESFTITHGVTDYPSVTSGPDVSVTVTDDDTATVTVNPTSLTVAEDSHADVDISGSDYTVVLDHKPAGDVTVTINAPTGTDFRINKTSLTFTSVNWATAQTVTVTAIDDDDDADDTATITHTVMSTADTNYNSATAASVSLTANDNDTAGLTISPTSLLNITEGMTNTYTVRLATPPTGNVTVTPTAGSDSGVSVSPTSLMFTTGTWSTTQTVTVTASQDDDAFDDSGSISHTVTGYGSVTSGPSVSVSVDDDETAGLTLTDTTVTEMEHNLTVNEGSNATYKVKLSSAPYPSTDSVTLTVGGFSDTDVSASPATHTFTSTNWNTDVVITVTASEDNDGQDDEVTLTHTLSGTADNSDYTGVSAPNVKAKVDDNDTAGLQFSATSVTVTEATSTVEQVGTDAIFVEGSYTVKLATEPSDTVTVDLAFKSGASSDIRFKDADNMRVATLSLTFTTTNWNTAQTVTFSAASDDDAINDTATVEHTASGGDYASVKSDVSLTVTDDDKAAVVVSPTSVNMNEGDTVMYTIKLSANPSGNVSVDLNKMGLNAISSVTNFTTITPLIWKTGRMVSVTAVQDDDSDDEIVELTHSIRSGSAQEYQDSTETVPSVKFNITDDETAGVTLVPSTSLTVSENASNTYTLVLDTKPGGQVQITPSSTNGDLSFVDSEDATIDSSNPVTFTTGNWDTAQTVTVKAAEDDDGQNDSSSITHSMTGYSEATLSGTTLTDSTVTAPSLSVTITDNDTAALNATPSPVEDSVWKIYENATFTSKLTLKLDTQPINSDGTAGSTTLTITPPTGIDASTTSVTFTSINWKDGVEVTFEGDNDLNAVNESVAISFSFSGADYGSVTVSDISATVIDDDVANFEFQSTTTDDNDTPDVVSDDFQTITAAEGTSTVTYAVRPTAQPSGTVTFTIVDPTDNTDVTAEPASLTFSGSDWQSFKDVTLTVVQDNDAFDDKSTITHTSAMTGTPGTDPLEFNNISIQNVVVTIDDDDQQKVVANPTSMTINEPDTGTTTATYTLTLAFLPTDDNGANSSVTVTINDPSNTDIYAEPASVTLNSSNWNTGATVTVHASPDNDTAQDTGTVTHTPSGADYARSGASTQTSDSVSVTVTDTDTPNVLITPSNVTVGEGQTNTGAYTVKLSTQPASDVTVQLSSNNTDVTFSSANLSSDNKLTFTNSSWNTTQSVSVTAAEDDDAAADSATITHDASGADYGSVADVDVTVTVTENDMLGVSVSESLLEIAELDDGTASDTYTIVLDAAPTGGNAMVQINVPTGSDLSTTPTSLTFTAANWDTAQTVTVRVANDLDAVDDLDLSITHVVSGADYGSNGITADAVEVDITDNDTAGVTLSTTTVTVAEDSTSTYTVVLDTQPTGNVTVVITDPANTVITADPAQLTFTPDNWVTPQTVTVSALVDPDANTDEGTITHSVSGGDYTQTPAIEVDDVTVTATDINTRGIEVEVTDDPYVLGEGEAITYRIRLTTEPSGPVTVTPEASNMEVTFTPATLEFTVANWDTYQTMEAAADQDDDAAAEGVVTVTHSATGSDYGDDMNVTADEVRLDIADDDMASVLASATQLDITEGTAGAYTIRLGSRPVGGDVTITLSVSGSPDVSVTPTTLTFTTANWDTTQQVNVETEHDTDTRLDTATITHTVTSAGNFDGATLANVSVRVIEDDMAMITIEPTDIRVGEGKSATYTVLLGTEPSGDVTIRAVSDNSDVSVVPSTLTFTSMNWNVAQVVVVQGGDDADAVNDNASITHTASGHEYEGEVGSTVSVLVVEDGSDVVNTSSFLRSSSCDSNLVLSWNSPVVEGTIDHYVIQWSSTDGSGSGTAAADATSYMITGLDNAVTYTVKVQALDDIGVPLWSREIVANPSADSCITEVSFGNILADSTPVIVEVDDPEPGTQVNMRYRSLNPGVWSEVMTKVLEEGETTAEFDIRGLKPDNPYEVQAWLGSQTPPQELDQDDAPEASIAQKVFVTGKLPQGQTFTGGGGSQGGRILRIEPGIASVVVSGGDVVLLSVDVWGRQNILDNDLADKVPEDGRPEFVWFSDGGGSFSEADFRSEWQNGLADDRTVIFTAPSHPGTILIDASLDGSFDCLAAQEDETAADQLARCSAQIEVTVRRSVADPISTTAPVNPPGTIPETLTDSGGVAYAIFTPVEGGSFVGDGWSLTAGSGAVANNEFIGISMAPLGDASNVGMTWHRYTLGGLIYAIDVVDAAGDNVSQYALSEPVLACVPMPAELGGNISDIVMTSTTPSGDLAVLSTRVRITPDGVLVCGALSMLPAKVAVGKQGSPADIDDEGAEYEELEPLPDTGGSVPSTLLLVLALILGTMATHIGMLSLRRARRRF